MTFVEGFGYPIDKGNDRLLSRMRMSETILVIIGDCLSDWRHILKGAPQGSLFGTFMYNVFSNDLLFILDKLNDISVYNYVDDTTVTCSDVNYDTAHTKLLDASDIMISWFENNNLQANPNKFQLIVFEEANEERSLAIHGADLQSSSLVKLLGVQIDQSLVFTEHISHLCIKAGRKINVSFRLCHSLTTDAKLLLMQTFI